MACRLCNGRRTIALTNDLDDERERDCPFCCDDRDTRDCERYHQKKDDEA